MSEIDNLSALFYSLFPDPYSLSFPRLLRRRRYANLDFCAVVRAERKCARAFFRISGRLRVGLGLA